MNPEPNTMSDPTGKESLYVVPGHLAEVCHKLCNSIAIIFYTVIYLE